MEITLYRDYSHLRAGDTFRYNNQLWHVMWNRTDNYKLGALTAHDMAKCPQQTPSTIFWWMPKD